MLGRWTCFHRLAPDEQEAAVRRMLEAKAYPLRLIFTVVKTQALIAVLRDEECRRALGLRP